MAARPRPRPSTKSEKESRLTRPRHTTACSLCVPGSEGAACAPPEVARKRPKEVGRRTRARGQRDRSHPPKPTRGNNATGPPNRCLAWQATACRSPRTAHAGRRVSADPRVRGERACRGTLWPARATKKAALAGPAQGNWSRSSNALPGEAGCTRAGTPDPTMPVNWTAHDARTDDSAVAAIIAVRPRNAISRHTCV